MPASAHTSSTTPPCNGTLAPQTPLRPAAGVTGTRASSHTASTPATSSTSRGRTTTAASPGTSPSSAQPMANGHQSRPASARADGSVVTSSQTPRSRANSLSSVSTNRAPMWLRTVAGPAVKAIGGVGAPRFGDTESGPHHLVEARLVQAAGGALVRHGSPVGRSLGLDLGLAPAQLGREHSGHVEGAVGGRVTGEEPGASSSGQHVVDRRGHLVARRVERLDLEVRQGRDEQLRERGLGGHHRQQRPRVTPVATYEVLEHRVARSYSSGRNGGAPR